jgi:hypothetical protein
MNIYVIILLIILGIFIFYIFLKKAKQDKIIEYLVKLLELYGKHVLNKVKLVLLINTLRTWVLANTKNSVLKFFIELFWPETDLLWAALNIENTDNKNEAIKSIPDVIVSKTVDNILNNTKFQNSDFSTTTNLKITEKDRGYLEAYLEGQINKLEEARIGIKGGIKF